MVVLRITQYGSTVYIHRDCHGIIAIHKEVSVFTFSFNSNDIKVENMSKSNCMQVIG